MVKNLLSTDYLLFVLLFFAGVFFFHACTKKEPPLKDEDFKYEYFPLKIGSWVIYDVDSICYDGCPTEKIWLNYQLKDSITSTFTDNEGRISHRIERYKRSDSTKIWDVEGVYFATRTKFSLEKIEDNLRTVNILFPPSLHQKWKGNTQINAIEEFAWYADWDYEVTELFETNAVTDSLLTVTEVNDSTDNPFEARFSLVKYQKNVGMIYQKIFHLEHNATNGDSIDLPWEVRANAGFIIEKRINSYGGL